MGGWCISDKEDLIFLTTSCGLEWTTDYNSTGIAGIIVTGRNEYIGNHIFLQATGYGGDSSVVDTGYDSVCLSRSRYDANYVYSLGFCEDDWGVSSNRRYRGYRVRPVLEVPE